MVLALAEPSGGFGGTGTESHGAVWSPNGRLLAVMIQNTTNKQSAIYLIDSKGNTVRRPTPPKLDVGNPDWAQRQAARLQLVL